MSHLKQVGAGIQNVVQALAFGQHRVAFLHDIVDVERCRRSSSRQPAPEGCFMRQDVMREPARSCKIIQSDMIVACYFRSLRHPDSPASADRGECRQMLIGGCDGFVSVTCPLTAELA